jgi:hypothetical protein
VLALDGEQGAAKSTTCRNLRKLVDPNKSDLRSPPRNEDDMLIAAISSRVIAWDNISFIDGERADSICRLATGGGFGKRKNYADLDEVIISVMRPILLNGIPSLLARGDLADRAIAITLPTIPDAERRTDSDMEDDFAAAAPSILALLLDGISMALRRLPGLKTRDLPRMADFARLAIAAAPAFGWTEAQIVAALASNRAAATGAVLDNDQVAVAVQALAVKQPTWTGNATALLEALVRTSPPDTPRERGWPRTANSLGQKLRRLAPALRRAGVIISLDRTGKDGQRIITISRLPE